MTTLLMGERVAGWAPLSGIARYVRRIGAACGRHFGAEAAICSRERLAPPPARWIVSPAFRGSGRLHVPDVIETCAAALLRPRLYFGTHFGAARMTAPQVFAVYDFIHELFPPASPSALYRRGVLEKRRCLERAEALVAISHHTAADIVRVYPHIDASKIVVTHLGVEDVFAPTQVAHTGRPYFIVAGVRQGHKNFARLIAAYASSGVHKDIDLRFVGPGARFTDAERVEIARHGVTSTVQLQAAVSTKDLARLYSQSVALVYPSIYEGFGLPVLEAMASGTIVAASNAASVPEAGGTAAFYFDPLDVGAMAETLRSVARLDATARAERCARGVQWAGQFTWARCERQTMALFDQLIYRR